MCGIAGYAGPEIGGVLETMTAAVRHRGPDAMRCWHDRARNVHLGHQRLSILDHAGGAQPMQTADGELVVVFNGELYNFAELRQDLESRGHRFVSDHSDTEVLLHGYREWGRDLPRQLNGMWAFVIHDRANRRLFASRDRFGEKPLYYSDQPGAFLFASELSALRQHPAMPARLSRIALKKYFGYGYIPAPHTIFEGVHKLPAGHSFTFDLNARRLELHRYWTFVLEPMETEPRDAMATWSEELRDLLDRSVRRRLVADVPVGIFLSGGIDSSAVAAFASRHVDGGRLATFHVGFNEPSFDESAHARRVADFLRTDHHAETLDLEVARALLPDIAARLDEPMGDASLLPTFLLSGFARRHVTVALGGDGGDELFAGYDPFRALRAAENYARWVPRPVHQAIRLLAARLPVSHRHLSGDFKIKRTLRGLSYPPRLWLPAWMAPLDPGELGELFNEPVEPEDVFSEAIAAWESCRDASPVDRALQFFTELYFQNDILTKVDRASMMHGLEVRSPFLDNDVVEFVRRLPARWKFRDGETKFLLKRALEPVLPYDVLHRRKKGFGVPVGAWFAQGALSIETDSLPGGLNANFLTAAASAHRAGRADHGAFLWNAWLLAAWSASHAQP
jgi:asparagine synthase (glutamine-hydrolysing)